MSSFPVKHRLIELLSLKFEVDSHLITQLKIMSASVTNIPRFLLPQLSRKTLSRSSLPVASRIHPPTKGPAPWKPTHRSVSSLARRCKYDEHALLSLGSHQQGPPLARCSYVLHNHRKGFSTTPPLSRDHHFDTLKFVQRLKDEGFSEEQSKAMMLVLSDVIEESIQNLTRTMVLREGLQFSSVEHLPIRR